MLNIIYLTNSKYTNLKYLSNSLCTERIRILSAGCILLLSGHEKEKMMCLLYYIPFHLSTPFWIFFWKFEFFLFSSFVLNQNNGISCKFLTSSFIFDSFLTNIYAPLFIFYAYWCLRGFFCAFSLIIPPQNPLR